MTVLQGRLADRDAWSAVGECPIEKTMALLGTKSAMLILREAYYGTTRFDDFCARVGITRAAAAARLNELVDAGTADAAALPRARPARPRRVRADAVGCRLHAGGLGDVRVGPPPPAEPLAAAARARRLRRRGHRRDPLREGPSGAARANSSCGLARNRS